MVYHILYWWIITQLWGGLCMAVVFMDEDDVATYTIKTIDDPRTLNKTLYLRPPENILTQRELIQKWEKLIGKQLEKSSISAQDFLSSTEGNKNTPLTQKKIKKKLCT